MKLLTKSDRSGGSLRLPHWVGASLIILALVLLLLPQIGLAQGEQQPCRFFGTVEVDGYAVSEGTEIITWIDGVVAVLRGGPHTIYVRGKDAAGNWQAEASATTAGWTVATTLPIPVATLSGQPSGVVNYKAASITVGGAGVVAYKYMLDINPSSTLPPLPWSSETAVAIPITLSGLSDGLHTIYVIGKNDDDQWQAGGSATSASWTVATTLPTPIAALSGQPSGVVNYNTVDISVGGTGVVAYKYKLDSGDWSGEWPISVHITVRWFTITGGQSQYYLDVPADNLSTPTKDGGVAGDVLRFKVSYSGTEYQAAQTGVWQLGMFVEVNLAISTTAPVATLTGQPTGVTNKRKPEDITVGGAGVVDYKYKLDDGTWSAETPVDTPISLPELTDGEHTLSVIGKNNADEWQPEGLPTTASWTVDTSIPVATLSGQPTGVVNYNTADIRVLGENVVAYEYKLDDGDWSTERPVGTHITLSGLSDGQHAVSVIGKNAAGSWQPPDSATSASWAVDTTLPTATLSGQPRGVVSYKTADITVGGQYAVAYKYKLDGGTWSAETPVSTHIILSGLSDGLHTVSVIAKNALNHWQAESNVTTASWTVNTTPTLATLSGQPSGVVNYNTADITVGGTGVVAYKYKLDSGTWGAETPVSTHIAVSGLSDGSHTVSVIGKSALGLWQAEADATTVSWTVDTAPPSVPSLLSPANEAKTSDTTPTFDWSDVTDPSGVIYSLQVDDDADFSSPIVSKEGLTESTYTLTKDEALPKGIYYWRVEAVDGAGNIGGWTDSFSFTEKKGGGGGCGCGSGTKTSTSGLFIGLGIMGFCWGTGFYVVRRVSRRKNTETR